MRIRFLSEQIYDTGAPGKGPLFPRGSVLDEDGVAVALKAGPVTSDYAQAFLRRWVNRGVAEYVGDEVEASNGFEHAPGISPGKDTDPFGTKKHGRASTGLDGSARPSLNYPTMTRDALDALAKERQIDISDAKNKGDVIAALELFDESSQKIA